MPLDLPCQSRKLASNQRLDDLKDIIRSPVLNGIHNLAMYGSVQLGGWDINHLLAGAHSLTPLAINPEKEPYQVFGRG